MMSMSRPLIAVAVSSSLSIGLAILYCKKRRKAEVTSVVSYVETESVLKHIFDRHGLEVYSFKVGWYNDVIDKIKKDVYKPDYPKDTIGFIIIKTPYFFEKGVKPFVRMYAEDHGIDSLDTMEPYDGCMKYLVSEIRQAFPSTSIEDIHADEKVKKTKQYFGVQAAGHVSGGARFYRREDVVPDPWPQDKPMSGVTMHPRYGGWFLFGRALIFPGLTYPGLLRAEPEDAVPTRDLKIELLEKVNSNDQAWRDVIHVDKRDSDEQRRFSDATNEQKIAMMREWVEEGRR